MAKIQRCGWSTSDPTYIEYHDREWGVPLHDDRGLFEFLVLEGAQAGLSWLTILKRRQGYRRAFDGFEPAKVARYDSTKVKKLLSDRGIIRNRLKIASAVNNARAFLKVVEEFGSFDRYIWGFVGGKTVDGRRRSLKDIPARTDLSDRISVDLKDRGFSFVGSTIVYAHMQATGMVNDHLMTCFRHRELRRGSRRSGEPVSRRAGRSGMPISETASSCCRHPRLGGSGPLSVS
jgi:DNA-3-methyladenine glycosylase I